MILINVHFHNFYDSILFNIKINKFNRTNFLLSRTTNYGSFLIIIVPMTYKMREIFISSFPFHMLTPTYTSNPYPLYRTSSVKRYRW